RTKNRRPHDVPLSPLAVGLLPPRRDCAFVFGRRPDSGFSGWSKCKERLDRRSGVDGWTVHDLRRTVASEMARTGVALPVIERVLNHVSGSFGGVCGVYQRYSFAAEKRAALDAWAVELERITA